MDGPEWRSMMRTRTPRRTSWFASMSPVGPAPTTSTSVSMEALLTAHTVDARSEAVDSLAGRDEEEMTVVSAEADVPSPGFWHGDLLDLLSGVVEDGHALAGQVDIAFAVDRHAVRSQLAEEPLVCQLAGW